MTINQAAFFASARMHLFNGSFTQSQVNGIDAILAAWGRMGDDDLRKLAYVLATAFHETARTMQPIEEYGKGRGRPYGVPTGPWHQVYDGRGLVQLTWEYNYKKATIELKSAGVIDDTIDLEKTPELAMRPDIAAAIAILGMLYGWFTTKKLSDYINANGQDFVGARRIINGQDRAVVIGGYAVQFLTALQAGA